MRRDRLRITALWLLLLAVPTLTYWGGFNAYFEGDDLTTLTWASVQPPAHFARDVFQIQLPYEPSRPLGYLFYSLSSRAFGLKYGLWAVAILFLNLLNLALLWLLLRDLRFSPAISTFCALFWAVNRALLEAWWKPMFVYDVLGTGFALACLLLYIRRRWLWSLLALWLALRSKEITLTLPLILFAYEMLLGERQWKRILLFAAPAAAVAAGGWWFIRTHGNGPYQASIGWAAQWKAISFYSAAAAGHIAAAGLAFLVTLFHDPKERRLWFGAACACASIAVYLCLPDRLLPVYLYWAMAGLAVIVAVALDRLSVRFSLAATGGLCLLLASQAVLMRPEMDRTLVDAIECRAYVAALGSVPSAPVYAYTSAPASLHYWGIVGALRLLGYPVVKALPFDSAEFAPDERVPLLDWDAKPRRLETTDFLPSSFTSLPRGRKPARWQLPLAWQADADGWRSLEHMRTLRLFRPRKDAPLEIEACGLAGTRMRAFVEFVEIQPFELRQNGCTRQTLAAPPSRVGVVVIDLAPVGEPPRLRIGEIAFRPGA